MRVGWFTPCEKGETGIHLADVETEAGWLVAQSVSGPIAFSTLHAAFSKLALYRVWLWVKN